MSVPLACTPLVYGIVAAVIVLLLLAIVAVQVPEMRRYFKIRSW